MIQILYLFYTNSIMRKIHNNTISAYKFNYLNLFILIDLALDRAHNLLNINDETNV